MPFDHSETVRSSFRDKLLAARQHRSQSVSRAAARVDTLSSLFQTLNEDLDRRLTFFNDPSRLRSSARLYAERRPPAVSYDPTVTTAALPAFALMGAVRFRTAEIGGPSKRRVLARHPTKRDLVPYFFAEEIPWVHGALESIRVLSRRSEEIRTLASAVGAAVATIPVEAFASSPLYSPEPAPLFMSPAEKLRHYQREITQATVVRIHAANGYLDALEAEIDEACMRFNGIVTKYRRRGKLLCYWEVNPPVRIDTCRTVKGPTFYTLSLGRHTLSRVRTGGSDDRHPPRNSVTKVLLKQCYLTRYADAYLEQAARIEHLRASRLAVISALQTIVRVLRRSPRIQEEISHV